MTHEAQAIVSISLQGHPVVVKQRIGQLERIVADWPDERAELHSAMQYPTHQGGEELVWRLPLGVLAEPEYGASPAIVKRLKLVLQLKTVGDLVHCPPPRLARLNFTSSTRQRLQRALTLLQSGLQLPGG